MLPYSSSDQNFSFTSQAFPSLNINFKWPLFSNIQQNNLFPQNFYPQPSQNFPQHAGFPYLASQQRDFSPNNLFDPFQDNFHFPNNQANLPSFLQGAPNNNDFSFSQNVGHPFNQFDSHQSLSHLNSFSSSGNFPLDFPSNQNRFPHVPTWINSFTLSIPNQFTNSPLLTSSQSNRTFGTGLEHPVQTFTNTLQNTESTCKKDREQVIKKRKIESSTSEQKKRESLNPSAVAALQEWYNSHIGQPYPDDSAVTHLCTTTELTAKQVKVWNVFVILTY